MRSTDQLRRVPRRQVDDTEPARPETPETRGEPGRLEVRWGRETLIVGDVRRAIRIDPTRPAALTLGRVRTCKFSVCRGPDGGPWVIVETSRNTHELCVWSYFVDHFAPYDVVREKIRAERASCVVGNPHRFVNQVGHAYDVARGAAQGELGRVRAGGLP